MDRVFEADAKALIHDNHVGKWKNVANPSLRRGSCFTSGGISLKLELDSPLRGLSR